MRPTCGFNLWSKPPRANSSSLSGENLKHTVITRITELRREAQHVRHDAMRAASAADIERLMHQAEELEKEALLLEKRP